MCLHVCIWIGLALGGVHPAWHALSAWLNSEPVLEVFLSLHIKYTHMDRHTTLPTESSLQDYPKFLLAFLPSFPHVIIMDCVRILNLSSLELFYPPSLYDSAFFYWHTPFYSTSAYSWRPFAMTFLPFFGSSLSFKCWPFQHKPCPKHMGDSSTDRLLWYRFFFFLNMCTSHHCCL